MDNDRVVGDIRLEVPPHPPGVFFDTTLIRRIRVHKESGEGLIALGDVFRGDRSELANGIIIFSNDELVRFQTHTPDSPLLLVAPQPD